MVNGLTHTAAKAGYWATQGKLAGVIETVQPDTTLGCCRVSVVWTRSTPAGTREDVCVYGLAIADIVGGGLYGVLDSAKMATAEPFLDTFNTALKVWQTNGFTLNAYRWHEHRANHPATPKGFETIGPAVRVTGKTGAGGNPSSRNTDQVSCTISLRTTSRRHWGRIYVPGLAIAAIDASVGRISSTVVDAYATAMKNLEASLAAASLQLGVWTWDKQAFLPVSQIRCDDVADIQRRRRPKQVNYSKTF